MLFRSHAIEWDGFEGELFRYRSSHTGYIKNGVTLCTFFVYDALVATCKISVGYFMCVTQLASGRRYIHL